MTDPKAGNDVYLTIDKNLQISAYKLLEEKLAGIVLSKLSNVLDYDPSAEKDTKYIKIPVGDAYNSFIANEIIDMKNSEEQTQNLPNRLSIIRLLRKSRDTFRINGTASERKCSGI